MYDQDIYAIDFNTVRRITLAGNVTTVAGNWALYSSENGVGTSASFGFLGCMATSKNGYIYVNDEYANAIRQIDILSSYNVTTFLSDPINDDYTESISSLAVDSSGYYLYFATFCAIYKCSLVGIPTTVLLSGTPNQFGFIDGYVTKAQFGYISGMVFSQDQNLYVADNSNNAIRQITPDGQVYTIIQSSYVEQKTDIILNESSETRRKLQYSTIDSPNFLPFIFPYGVSIAFENQVVFVDERLKLVSLLETGCPSNQYTPSGIVIDCTDVPIGIYKINR
jgi:hypothetical protein